MMASDRDSIFERVYDKGTVQWILGVLVALWLAVSGFLYAEIAAVRDDVARNGEAVAGIAARLESHGERLGKIESGLDRIETLLQERPPPAN